MIRKAADYVCPHSGAESETIDRGCPVQTNRIFGSKKNLFFTIRPLFFSEPRGWPGAGWRLPWIRPSTFAVIIGEWFHICCHNVLFKYEKCWFCHLNWGLQEMVNIITITKFIWSRPHDLTLKFVEHKI
jgi:hypothetical protein